jgi:hypothetical protein
MNINNKNKNFKGLLCYPISKGKKGVCILMLVVLLEHLDVPTFDCENSMDHLYMQPNSHLQIDDMPMHKGFWVAQTNNIGLHMTIIETF